MASTRSLQVLRQSAAAIGTTQEKVATRRQLSAVVPRWFIRNELRRERWQTHGKQVIVLHNGPITVEAARWAAVLEVGAAIRIPLVAWRLDEEAVLDALEEVFLARGWRRSMAA